MIKSGRKLLATALFSTTIASPAVACGIEPFLGEVCLVAFNFCPRGYAKADGQLISISQNTALFALLGTTYGGNGRTTFALPDLRGRAPVHSGQGPGLVPVDMGEEGGAEFVTLTVAQMPAHSHTATLKGTGNPGTSDTPIGNVPARLPHRNNYAPTAAGDMGAGAVTVGTAGGSQPVDIRNPYVGMNYCIAVEGVFPARD